MSPSIASLLGGGLIGLSVALMLLLHGRIAGISGLVAGIGKDRGERRLVDAAFVAGLVLGLPAFAWTTGAWPEMRIGTSLPVLAVAGLFVGFGTRLGSGCTSGHGVAGLSRLSPRSIAAVLTFLSAGMLTVALVRAATS